MRRPVTLMVIVCLCLGMLGACAENDVVIVVSGETTAAGAAEGTIAPPEQTEPADATTATTATEATVPITTVVGGVQETSARVRYVLNTSSKKIHLPSCASVGKIKDGNREDTERSLAELRAAGYTPCGSCHPENEP